jgi:hypothetical protein
MDGSWAAVRCGTPTAACETGFGGTTVGGCDVEVLDR